MTNKSTIHLEGDGFVVTACRGANGCPRRAEDAPDLAYGIHAALERIHVGERLRERLGNPLRAHNIIKVAISYCPNACGRSQIADVGLIGACLPQVAAEACIGCGQCAEACKEDAVRLDPDGFIYNIDTDACLGCGGCINACPAEALLPSATGFRLMLGGKLGRHPRFAEELPGIQHTQSLPALTASCIEQYMQRAKGHERVGDVITRLGAQALCSGQNA